MATKFFLCPVCGNVVVKIEDSGVTPHCCGKEMVELKAKTVESLVEKHLPVLEFVDGRHVKVKVGSEPHPMLQEHHICFIWLETVHGGQLRYLTMNGCSAPEACAEFCKLASAEDPVVAVYEYCNLHGLWKLEVNERASADSDCGCPATHKSCFRCDK